MAALSWTDYLNEAIVSWTDDLNDPMGEADGKRMKIQRGT
jgi:hypothetical protein